MNEYPVFSQEALTRAILLNDYVEENAQKAYRDGGEPGPATHAVWKDSAELFQGTEKQCGVYAFHAGPGRSWEWVHQHEGWDIRPLSAQADLE